MRNSTRLTKKDVIRRRIDELQSRGAERAEVSVASLLSELEEARQKATNLDQLSAAVRAIEAKAKVSGLLVQKVEVGGPNSFDSCGSTADIADQMLNELVMGFRPVDEQDRQGLIDLLERNFAEVGEYISAIKARPITATPCDPASTANWRELKPHPSAYVDNPAEAPDKLINHRHRRLTHGNGSQRTVR